MDLKDFKEMWNKLQSVCTEVGQGTVYLILQKLLNYPKITKSKGYKKPIIQIFAQVKYLYKHFQLPMTPGRDLWDIIVIVIGLNSLHSDFDTTIASLLETSYKMIDQIQSILQSKKAKNLSKQAIKDMSDLAIVFRDKRPKKKTNSDNKYYNCHKLGHFEKDSFLPDKRLNKTTQQFRRRKSQGGNSRKGRNGQSNTSNKVHQFVENEHNDDSNPKPFAFDPV